MDNVSELEIQILTGGEPIGSFRLNENIQSLCEDLIRKHKNIFTENHTLHEKKSIYS